MTQPPHDLPFLRRLLAVAGRTLPMAAIVLWASPAQAANEALIRLMQVLRDRGSITAAEFDEIKKVADASDAAAAQGPPAATTVVSAPSSSGSVSGAWYERISLHGYGQLRYSGVDAGSGVLEVPTDRSVNQPESFVLRRTRVTLAGDVADRLSVFAQADLAASIGTGDFAAQLREAYGDVWLDTGKRYRLRIGQHKVPFGWSNLQSSQSRAPFERPDAINSAAESERDPGAALLWTSPRGKQLFRDIAAQGLKGTGDYGMVSIGAYAGQGPNRSDQNGEVHVAGRVAVPFQLKSGRFVELGVQGYTGHFVSPTQAVTVNGVGITPSQRADGVLDQRVAFSAVWYPQPLGVEAEWTVGRGPELSADSRSIGVERLHGGYVQVNYRAKNAFGTWFPFTRWNYYDGGRKFGRNAPHDAVNEVDIGVEFAKWAEFELTGVYTRTIRRSRTGVFPYLETRDANRVGFQLQWNY